MTEANELYVTAFKIHLHETDEQGPILCSHVKDLMDEYLQAVVQRFTMGMLRDIEFMEARVPPQDWKSMVVSRDSASVGQAITGTPKRSFRCVLSDEDFGCGSHIVDGQVDVQGQQRCRERDGKSDQVHDYHAQLLRVGAGHHENAQGASRQVSDIQDCHQTGVDILARLAFHFGFLFCSDSQAENFIF